MPAPVESGGLNEGYGPRTHVPYISYKFVISRGGGDIITEI